MTCPIGIDLSAPSSLVARPVALPRRASSPLPSRRGVFSVATVISLAGAFDQLLRNVHVCLCPDRCHIVQDDWLAKARSFCEPHISWDNTLENLGTEILPGIFSNLAREVKPGVVHG